MTIIILSSMSLQVISAHGSPQIPCLYTLGTGMASNSPTLAAFTGSRVQYTPRFNQYLSREEPLPKSFFWTQHIEGGGLELSSSIQISINLWSDWIYFCQLYIRNWNIHATELQWSSRLPYLTGNTHFKYLHLCMYLCVHIYIHIPIYIILYISLKGQRRWWHPGKSCIRHGGVREIELLL